MLELNKGLLHRVKQANKKTVTVFHRVPKRMKSQYAPRVKGVQFILGQVDTYLTKTLAGKGAGLPLGSFSFSKADRNDIIAASTSMRVVFHRIVPSKQPEARAAYEQVIDLLADLRGHCNAVAKKA